MSVIIKKESKIYMCIIRFRFRGFTSFDLNSGYIVRF